MTAKLPLVMFTTWLASGERGISSEAIVSQLTGYQVGRYSHRGDDHPHDPADLRRCIQLLDAHDLAALVFKDAMPTRGPVWAALVARWDELVALFREEQREGTGRAPRTYALMRELIDAARSTP